MVYNFVAGALLGLVYYIVGFELTDWQFYFLLFSVSIITHIQHYLNYRLYEIKN